MNNITYVLLSNINLDKKKEKKVPWPAPELLDIMEASAKGIMKVT